jgi:hypothetical protein
MLQLKLSNQQGQDKSLDAQNDINTISTPQKDNYIQPPPAMLQHMSGENRDNTLPPATAPTLLLLLIGLTTQYNLQFTAEAAQQLCLPVSTQNCITLCKF